MSGKNKSYNSIIFLTTLSVYLGLVLVSGSACGLSNAALTKSFDLKNEIEFKDEFDNNPDKDFPALLAELVEEIREKEISREIKSPFSKDFNFETTISESSMGGGSGSYSLIREENLGSLIRQSINREIKPLALKYSDAQNDVRNAKFRLNLDAEKLSLDVSIHKTDSEEFADFLRQKFFEPDENAESKLKSQVCENTEISAKGNQVFIVTRLPRASIDESLLKL